MNEGVRTSGRLRGRGDASRRRLGGAHGGLRRVLTCVGVLVLAAMSAVAQSPPAGPPSSGDSAGLRAKTLDDPWRYLSEATTRQYYRGHAPSDSAQIVAAVELLSIESSGDAEQRRAAQRALDLLGRESVAEARRHISATFDSPEEIPGLLLDVLVDPDGAEMAVANHLLAKAALATAYAMERAKRQKLLNALQSVWREHVLPAVEAAAGEVTVKPSIKVTAGLLRSDVWLAARNVSGKTLTNCTLNMRIREGDNGPADLTCFIVEWPANAVIYPSYFSGWIHAAPGKEAEYSKLVSVEYESWSDQSRSLAKNAEIVDGYSIRDPFCEGLFGRSARYVDVSATERAILRFHGVTKNGKAPLVEATVEIEDLATKRTKKTRYRGSWVEDKNSTSYFHPAAPWIRMTPVGSPGRDGSKAKGPVRDLITLRWMEGRITLTPSAGRIRDLIAVSTTPITRRETRTPSSSSSPESPLKVGLPAWFAVGTKGTGTLVIGHTPEDLTWEVRQARSGTVHVLLTLKARGAVLRYRVHADEADDAAGLKLADPLVLMKSKKPVPDLGSTLELGVTRTDPEPKLKAKLQIGKEEGALILESASSERSSR